MGINKLMVDNGKEFTYALSAGNVSRVQPSDDVAEPTSTSPNFPPDWSQEFLCNSRKRP